MYAGIPTKLRISTAVLLGVAVVFTGLAGFSGLPGFTGLPGFNGTVSAQEPSSPDSIDATKKRLPYDEKAAQSIDGMLMCPVCPAETIGQAQVPIAKQMRRLVREKLAQGESREQILEYFAGVYGPSILAAPSKSGFNLLAWTVPLVGVFGALAAGFFVLRSMTVRSLEPAGPVRTASETAGNADTQENLALYLQAVDRDLGITEFPGSKETNESRAENSEETSVDEPDVNRGANG